MSGLFLLDTNSISDLVRHPKGRVAHHLARHGMGNVCTSIIVAAELRYGAAKSPSLRIAQRVQEVLATLPISDLAAPVDEVYGALRADLERSGQLIGQNDLFIAAHALALDATLVTANEREFSRVPRLRIENWRR